MRGAGESGGEARDAPESSPASNARSRAAARASPAYSARRSLSRAPRAAVRGARAPPVLERVACGPSSPGAGRAVAAGTSYAAAAVAFLLAQELGLRLRREEHRAWWAGTGATS